MIRVAVSLVFLASAAVSIAAPKGKNLGDAERWRESETLLKRNEKSAAERCGVALPITYDEKALGARALDEAKPIDTYCRDAYNALFGSVCISPEGKDAVKAKVSGVSCRFSTTGTHVKLEGKTLVIEVDPAKRELDGAIPGGSHWSSAIKSTL